jgi:hypothetical protein
MHRLTSIYRAQYNASSKKEKGYWVHRVIREIREAGGRFLQLKSSAGIHLHSFPAQIPKPSRDFFFELVDDMTAYKKVSHAFRSKGRTRMLVPTSSNMIAHTVDVDPPPILPVAPLLLQQQLPQQPQAGNAGLPNTGLAGGANPIQNVLARLTTSYQNPPLQLLTQMFVMAQLQQLFALIPGLPALLIRNLSGGTVESNQTLDQNMLMALLVRSHQQIQQQRVIQQQQLSPLNSLLSLTAPFLSRSSNIFPQHGMSLATNRQPQQLLQANRLSHSPGSASAAAAANTSSDNATSEQSRGSQENNNSDDLSQS